MTSNVALPHEWRARSYQRDFMNHMFERGQFPFRKRAMPVWHRRAGKDSVMLNTLAVASQMRTGTYWHLLPTLNQGRKVIWNGIDGNSKRMIYQAFPYELIDSSNENEMILKLKNGSFYQVVGSDNYDALVGTNPLGVVFSEWALADPAAWNFVRPILAENGGFAAFITTPRGKNHAYELFKMAVESPHWFTSVMTVNDTFRDDGTHVITPEMIQMERDEGVSDEIINQEYYCSWEGINQGSIYGRQLQKYAPTNQIDFGKQFDPNLPVYTAWDLGRRDATAVWFYQLVQGEVQVIDYLEFTQMDVDEVLGKLKELPYAYGVAALPHDAKARTFASRYTTYERFVANKFTAYVVPMAPVNQGINAVRALLPDLYFNIGSKNVRKGLDKLAAYQYEWDDKNKVFKAEPLHDSNSHCADSMRTLAMSKTVVSAMVKNRNTTRKHEINTPIGRALNLETLFREREAAQSAYKRV